MKKLLIILLLITNLAFAEKPNFLVIIADDQNYGTVNERWMPNVKKEIFDKGISFENAYISNPTCCPSRAGIFTGQYSKNNGQFTNNPFHNLKVPTCGSYMKAAGYKTGIIGKYLNSHTAGYQEFQQKQFDFWFEVDKKRRYTLATGEAGYLPAGTHLDSWITENTIDVLDELKDNPFLLYVTFHSPHGLAPLDKSYKHIFKPVGDRLLNESLPNYMRPDSNKPAWIKNNFGAKVENHKKIELESFNKLQVVDIHIKSIIDTLRKNGQYDNTYIIYIADNGVLYGQHGVDGKSVAYESAIHVPMAISGPGISPAIQGKTVSNIDITPTIYSLAGINGGYIDGINLLNGKRDYLYLEGAYGSSVEKGRKGQPEFHGILKNNWRLITTIGDIPELYNIKTDPFQLNNLYNVDIQKRKELLNHLRYEYPELRIKKQYRK